MEIHKHGYYGMGGFEVELLAFSNGFSLQAASEVFVFFVGHLNKSNLTFLDFCHHTLGGNVDLVCLPARQAGQSLRIRR